MMMMVVVVVVVMMMINLLHIAQRVHKDKFTFLKIKLLAK